MSVGVSWELFWHLNPKKLKPFIVAYQNKVKEMDALVHSWIGTYGISALTVSIASCFGDRNAKYIEKPIMFEDFDNCNLTQEEIDNREIQKMILAEEMWIKQQKRKGLPETVTL